VPPFARRAGISEQGEKGACPVNVGLLSAIGALLYGGTIAALAFVATFARRRGIRLEARATLQVLVGRAPASAPEVRGDLER
jgi:hypothetical protein